jgi:hypothetical protein
MLSRDGNDPVCVETIEPSDSSNLHRRAGSAVFVVPFLTTANLQPGRTDDHNEPAVLLQLAPNKRTRIYLNIFLTYQYSLGIYFVHVLVWYSTRWTNNNHKEGD